MMLVKNNKKYFKRRFQNQWIIKGAMILMIDEKDHEEFEEVYRRIEKIINDKDGNEMNVDINQ